jgi:hypothetical protein
MGGKIDSQQVSPGRAGLLTGILRHEYLSQPPTRAAPIDAPALCVPRSAIPLPGLHRVALVLRPIENASRIRTGARALPWGCRARLESHGVGRMEYPFGSSVGLAARAAALHADGVPATREVFTCPGAYTASGCSDRMLRRSGHAPVRHRPNPGERAAARHGLSSVRCARSARPRAAHPCSRGVSERRTNTTRTREAPCR